MMTLDTNELVLTIVDQAHTIRRQAEEIERLTQERNAAAAWQRRGAEQADEGATPTDQTNT